jgi:hypothetical protein
MSRASSLARINASVAGALGYTPVNKAGDTLTGPLTVGITDSNGVPLIASNGGDGDQIQIRQPNRGGNFGWQCSGTSSENYVVVDRQRSSVLEIHGKTNHIFRTNDTDRLTVDASGRITMPYQPGFMASGSGGWVTISAGGAAPFNAIASSGFNDGGHYSTSTYAFTAPVAGKYVFFAGFYCGNSTSSSSFYWLRNGSWLNLGGGDALVFADTAESDDYALSSQIVLKLSAGDYIQIASRNTQSSKVYMPHSSFGGYLIG